MSLFFTVNSFGQLVGSSTVKANFGVEADAYANLLLFPNVDGIALTPTSGTDDWFKTVNPPSPPPPQSLYLGPGLGVIDQNNIGVVGNPSANILNELTANSNFSFEKRQSLTAASGFPVIASIAGFPIVRSPFSDSNGPIDYLWLDAVYGRDNNLVGNQAHPKDDTFFIGTADKNSDNPATWNLGSAAGGPQKDDIIDVMAHLRGTKPAAPGVNHPGDDRPFDELWAFAAATLRSTSGSKHIDFEFFRTLVSYAPGDLVFGNTGPANQGGRTAFTFKPDGSVDVPGCIIISIDYEGGGTKPDVRIRVWMEESVFNNLNNLGGRPFDAVPGTFLKGLNSGNFGYGRIALKNGDTSTNIFGRVNAEGSTLAAPWGTLEGEKAESFAEYQTFQHVEIGINLTAFGLDRRGISDPCANVLGSLLVKTRSSAGGGGDSFTSELKDFAGPYRFGNTIPPPIPAVTDLTACESGATGMATFDLKNAVTDSQPGTTETFHLTSAEAVAGTGAILTPEIYTTSSDSIYVRRVYTGTLCAGVKGFKITVNNQPDAGGDGNTTVCESSVTPINLFSLITGEDLGGTWTRESGTGGT
ncbi:hypothetical protein, partial [Flavobacterium undicola]|uniref:hypothetical protein n=1 Tax=Flavobacterium undicola TaxID=1932779 RepID=UPI0015E23A44